MGDHFQNNLPSDRLQMHVQEIENLEEQKAEIAEAIKDRYSMAKHEGFEAPVMKRVIERRKLARKLGRERVEELDALLNIYEVAIGERSDLSEFAKKRFEREWIAREMQRKKKQEDPDQEQPDLEDLIDKVAEAEKPEATEEEIEKARQDGREAAKAGKSVRDNPHKSEGPLRAAWDMGWCQGAGSDGMDIPQAFQRRTPKKEEKPENQKPDDEEDAADGDDTTEDDTTTDE